MNKYFLFVFCILSYNFVLCPKKQPQSAAAASSSSTSASKMSEEKSQDVLASTQVLKNNVAQEANEILGKLATLRETGKDESVTDDDLRALAVKVGLKEGISRFKQLALEVDNAAKLMREELVLQQEKAAQTAMEELLKEEERPAPKKAKNPGKKKLKGSKSQGSNATPSRQQTEPITECVSVVKAATKPRANRKKGAKPSSAIQNEFSVIAASKSECESAYASALEEIKEGHPARLGRLTRILKYNNESQIPSYTKSYFVYPTFQTFDHIFLERLLL